MYIHYTSRDRLTCEYELSSEPKRTQAYKHMCGSDMCFFLYNATSLDNLNILRIMPMHEHLRNIVFINDKYSGILCKGSVTGNKIDLCS